MTLHHYLPATYLGEFSADETTLPRRDRLLSGGNKESLTTFQAPAKKLGAENNLYSLSNVGEYEFSVDDVWSDYEHKLSESINQLIQQNIDGSTWGRVLIPFVAAMLVRTPDFDRRFVKRVQRAGIDPVKITREHINRARFIDLQMLLGPVSVATWTVQKATGSDPLITNDIGYAPFRDPASRGIGFAIPLNKSYILTIAPQLENTIAYADGNVWKPIVHYVDLPTDEHERFNHVIASTAEQFIFGADNEIIKKYLTQERNPFLDSPFEIGLIPNKYARAFQFTWHRLIPALERNPKDETPWNFAMDYEQLGKGWVSPISLPINLVDFPSPLRREGDTIVAELYDPEVYYILSQIIELELIDKTEKIPVLARKGLEIATDPELISTFLIALGNFDLEKENLEAALEFFNQALVADPNSDIAFANIGTVYAKQERYELAIGEYKKAIIENPDSGFAYLNLAQVYISLEDWKNAKYTIESAITLLPPGAITGQAYLAQALLFENQEMYDNALKATGKALHNYKESDDIAKCWHRKSAILLKKGDTKKALEAINTSIEHNPQGIENHFLRAHIFRILDKSDEAIKHLEEFLVTSKTSDEEGILHDQLSKSYADSGNLTKAIVESRKATELDPDNREFLGQLGFVLLFNGDIIEAIALFDHILEVEPSNYGAHINRGIALYSQGEIEKAIKSLKNAIRHNENEDDGSPEQNIAKCYLMLHDTQTAFSYHESATSKEPDSIYNSPLKALIKMYEGDLKGALAIIQSPDVDFATKQELNYLLPLPLLFLGRIEDAIQTAGNELESCIYPISRIEFFNQLKSIGDHLGQSDKVEHLISCLDLT